MIVPSLEMLILLLSFNTPAATQRASSDWTHVTGQALTTGRFDFPTDARFDEPCRVRVELLYPDNVDYSVLKAGATFAVHEGQKIVATGRAVGEN